MSLNNVYEIRLCKNSKLLPPNCILIEKNSYEKAFSFEKDWYVLAIYDKHTNEEYKEISKVMMTYIVIDELDEQHELYKGVTNAYKDGYFYFAQISFHIPGSYTVKFFISKGNIKAEPLIQHCDVDLLEKEDQTESTPKRKRGKKQINISKRKQYPTQIVPQSKRPRKVSVTRYEELPANMTKTLWSKDEVMKSVGKELNNENNF